MPKRPARKKRAPLPPTRAIPSRFPPNEIVNADLPEEIPSPEVLLERRQAEPLGTLTPRDAARAQAETEARRQAQEAYSRARSGRDRTIYAPDRHRGMHLYLFLETVNRGDLLDDARLREQHAWLCDLLGRLCGTPPTKDDVRAINARISGDPPVPMLVWPPGEDSVEWPIVYGTSGPASDLYANLLLLVRERHYRSLRRCHYCGSFFFDRHGRRPPDQSRPSWCPASACKAAASNARRPRGPATAEQRARRRQASPPTHREHSAAAEVARLIAAGFSRTEALELVVADFPRTRRTIVDSLVAP
jgi:hypothetical protein